MSILDKIRELANLKQVSLAEIERQSGLSSGSITKWDKSSPSAEKLEQVAEYLGVSMDYLLDRTENKFVSTDNTADHFAEFFKIETEGMSEEEVEVLEKEWKQFLIIRKQMFQDDKYKK